jgi:glycosyltransferase involved in cell wall biosynthesis
MSGRAGAENGIRLLYVIDSLVAGGAESSLAALAPHYVRAGVELEVVYLHDRPGLQTVIARSGARVTFVGTHPSRFAWIRGLVGIVRDRRPDLVHTTLFEADVCGRPAARLAGRPVVSSLVNEGYGESHLDDPGLRRWRVRAAQAVDAATARLTPRMHAVSEFIADEMASHLRYPRSRIDVVPRGRDSAVLGRRSPERRSVARQGLGVTDGRPVVLAVARQEHQKGLDVLVDAMAEVRQAVPDVSLVVAGRDGAHTDALLAAVDRLDLGQTVRFLGARTDVGDLLCAADLFVLPSRREGSPGSVMEAMALEVPLVVSDIPQIREVVDESCARLVPPEDHKRLGEAIVASLQEPVAAEAAAHAAYARFLDRFTIEVVARRMIGFYERALGGR